jgi:hypothetical protein
MLRKTALIALALLPPLALLAMVAPTPAWAGPPPATGSVNCPIVSGSGAVGPGLTPAGSVGGVKINFEAEIAPPAGSLCGGNIATPPGDLIRSGTVTGSGYYQALAPPNNASACADFAGVDVVGKIVVHIAWVMTGPPIANTKIVYTLNPGTVNGAGIDTITLHAPGGTATKSGSFAAPAGPPDTVKIVTTLPGPACGPGPWTSFTITAGNVYV